MEPSRIQRSEPLVSLRPQNVVRMCWTTSLCDTVKISPKTCQWKFMLPDDQYRYYKEKYIPEVIKPCVDGYYFTFELNKKGQLHIHGSVWVNNPKGYSPEFWLTQTRKEVLHVPHVQRLSRNSARRAINLNHICLDDRGTWDEYIIKDLGKTPYDPIYWSVLDGTERS